MEEKYEQLINSFVKFPNVLKDDGFLRKYSMDNGDASSFFIWKDRESKIQINQFSVEGEFPLHEHDEDEYALIYSGHGVMYKEGKETKLDVGHLEFTKAGVPHSAYFPVRTEIIVLTMPPCKEYADGRND